jgi:hypothetical protein
MTKLMVIEYHTIYYTLKYASRKKGNNGRLRE